MSESLGQHHSNSAMQQRLRDLSIKPSDRLYRLMSDAPWETVAYPRQPRARLRVPRIAPRFLRGMYLLLGALILGAAAAFLAFDQTVSAQELLSFFRRAAAEIVEVTSGTPSESEILEGLEVSEAESLAEFSLLLPGELPYPFEFQSASYDPTVGSVRLNYSQSGRILWIRESMSPFTVDGNASSQIGPSAEVKRVLVHGNQAELVSGVWELSSEPSETDLELEWTSAVPAKTLRWRSGNVYLEIFVAGGSPGHPGYFSEGDLLQFAESLE